MGTILKHVNKTTDNVVHLMGCVGSSAERNIYEIRSLFDFIGETVLAFWEGICRPGKIRWQETRYYMNTCGVDGMPVTMLICFLLGAILGLQGAVQMHKYGADAYLPALIACVIVRELGPLMVAIVATGRSGSAFAAEIATMKISEELDAMVTFGFRPSRFLVVPKMIAMILMIPLLTVLGDLIGIIGGFIICNLEISMPLEAYTNSVLRWVSPKYYFEGLFKSVIFAWLITLIGCWRGFRTGNDAIGVGKATTSAVVLCILIIVVADTILSEIYNTVYMLLE